MPSVADFRVEILVEKVVDAGENSDATVAEIYFGREVPDVVTRYETFRRVIGVGEGLIHERAEKTYLHHVFPTINSPNLDQVVGGIGGVNPSAGPEVNSASSRVTFP